MTVLKTNKSLLDNWKGPIYLSTNGFLIKVCSWIIIEKKIKSCLELNIFLLCIGFFHFFFFFDTEKHSLWFLRIWYLWLTAKYLKYIIQNHNLYQCNLSFFFKCIKWRVCNRYPWDPLWKKSPILFLVNDCDKVTQRKKNSGVVERGFCIRWS